MDHYSVHAEGSPTAASWTSGATAADWDLALVDAKERAAEHERNHVVRHTSHEGVRVIATVDAEGSVIFPRLASPALDLGQSGMRTDTGQQLGRELELEAG